MPLVAGALDRLRAGLGPGAVLEDPADLVSYAQGARWADGRAAFVVRPVTTAEVSATLAWAFAERLRLVAQGANSGLVGASVPDASGTMGVLSLERLVRPLDVDPTGRTATVGAGVRLSTLNEAAGRHGLTFPIDLGADPSLGGMVSTNTGGSRLLRYGDVRHNLLGIEVVLPDAAGTVLDLATALRKANTGLDAKQIFVGTGGEFGVVTRVVVALHPVARRRAAALVVVANTEAALGVLVHLEGVCGSLVSAFELMSGGAIAAVVSHAGMRHPFHGSTGIPSLVALAELSAPEEEGPDLIDVLAGALGTAPDGAVIDAFLDTPEAAWLLRHRISESLNATGTVLAFDVSVARSALPRLRDSAAALLAGPLGLGGQLCDFGHAGDGGLHLNAWWPTGSCVPGGDALAALRLAVYDLVVGDLGGSFSAEHGLGPSNQEYARRYLPPEVLALSAALKDHFDPGRILGTLEWNVAPRR